jgi:tetratricopeptide (TPR) repeat protein
MKKILVATFVLIGASAFAQNAARTTAYMNLKDGVLDKALENIEPTIEHPKTMEDPKTWLYRGNVYYAIATSEDPNYKALSENPLKYAYESYARAMELDTKGRYKPDLEQQLLMTRIQALNQGVAAFQEQDYVASLEKFEMARGIAAMSGVVDTNAVYNGALSAERSQQYEKAIELYNQAIEIGFVLEGDTYAQLVGVYKSMENDDKVAEVIEAGRAKFPENEPLLFEQANLFFRQENFEGAQKALMEAVERVDEDRKIPLKVSIAGIYDKLGKSEEAKATYLEILEKDPNNFEANQAYGAFIFNEGVEANDKANEIQDNKKFNEAMKGVNAIFEKSLPYLEKAREVEPEDVQTLMALKQLYVRLKLNDKYADVKAKLDELGY